MPMNVRLSGEQRLLTREEVAARWGVSVQTIIRRVMEKSLREVRIGGRRRYRLEDVEAAEGVDAGD